MKNFSTSMIVNQKQMCAKRKTVIYLRIYLPASKTIFLRQNRTDCSKTRKTSGEDSSSEGQLNLVIIAQASFYSQCLNLPPHKPAPVSPSCLGRANVRAFHDNPNRIHTELAFINP